MTIERPSPPGGPRRLGVAAAMVDGRLVAGDVIIDGAGIVEIGAEPAGQAGVAVAGFVDLQVNGFAGADFTTADLDGYRVAATGLAHTGVTSFLATIPTTSPAQYPVAVATATEAARSDLPGARVEGIHLEGPFLSPARAGAHVREWLRSPGEVPLDELLAGDAVTLMTVAPELPGGIDLIRRLRARGIVVSIGHTDASAAVAHEAFDAGATMMTHLWNAHRPITSRDPGPGGAALARPDVFVGLIADLVHVARETVQLTVAAAQDHLVVVSDAVAAAGLGDGEHRFGRAAVHSRDGAVRLADGTLAGSAAGLDVALRNLVTVGVPLETAVNAVTAAPGRALGRPDLGRLSIGGRADIVVLSDDLTICQVLIAGREQL